MVNMAVIGGGREPFTWFEIGERSMRSSEQYISERQRCRHDPWRSVTQLMGSWDVFQTREQVLKSFGAVFEVKDYLPGDLDLLVLRKRDIVMRH